MSCQSNNDTASSSARAVGRSGLPQPLLRASMIPHNLFSHSNRCESSSMSSLSSSSSIPQNMTSDSDGASNDAMDSPKEEPLEIIHINTVDNTRTTNNPNELLQQQSSANILNDIDISGRTGMMSTDTVICRALEIIESNPIICGQDAIGTTEPRNNS